MIVDSEGPGFRAWSELYASYGCELPFDKYSACIGTIGGFDLHGYLSSNPAARSSAPISSAHATARWLELMNDQPLFRALHRVRHVGKDTWSEVGGRVELDRRVGDRQPQEVRVARPISMRSARRDHVASVKPDPALYLLALEKLGVAADEAIAFEDSPTGILAAKRAGLFCIAIPNPLTRDLPLELADRRLSSLEEFDLDHV